MASRTSSGSDQCVSFPLAPQGPTGVAGPMGPACFLQGTSLRTPLGQTYVEYLREGDLVSTADHGPLPIRWIGWQYFVFDQDDDPNKPILIKQDALGPGFPAKDTAFSPLHHILMHGPDIEFHVGPRQVLVQAHALTAFPRVRQMKGKIEARYYSVMLDHHALLWADNLLSESFYPSPSALARLGEIQREAIALRFPHLSSDTQASYGPPARQRLDAGDSTALTTALTRKKPQARAAAE